MTRTMWIALFCLVGLGPAIAIKVVTRPASPVVEAAQDQSGTEIAPGPNEAAKSDRLKLSDMRAESETMPAAQREPLVTPPAGPETIRNPGRRWQDANAKALPGDSLPRTGSGVDTGEDNASSKEAKPPLRFNRNGKASRIAPSEPPHRHAVAKRPIESAGVSPPKPETHAWHCRQDATGNFLRALDLSPRCNM
jgi:hypothetical protein